MTNQQDNHKGTKQIDGYSTCQVCGYKIISHSIKMAEKCKVQLELVRAHK